MVDARMVPILPCPSIDEIRDFLLPLGFEVTYRQIRPNPYLALRRGDIELHYNGIPGLRPEDSYGSCLLVTPDTRGLFEAFSAGLRTRYGRLPLTGFPRITRPRPRKNYGGLSGFSLIDPAGNWIRVVRSPDAPKTDAPDHTDTTDEPAATEGRLAAALANAIVSADSRGDVAQAARILAGAISREDPAATPAGRAEAHAYLAELHIRLDDFARAREQLDELTRLPLSPTDRKAAASALAAARELRETTAAVQADS
ncbi:VOC family protein [Embleya sp. NPDC055664]|uniref:VOC family protein n=1 Tax=Embleya sp. NPDC059237 TaxID=3346784 RepID=UPI0036BFA6B3